MKIIRVLAVLFIAGGVCILSWGLLFPLLHSYFESSETVIISPQAFAGGRASPWEQLLTKAGESNLPVSRTEPVPPEFTLQVKKLGILGARVFTDVDVSSPDSYKDLLTKGLGQVKDTAYPGEWGTVFIIGHSALPLFFSPNNYETIFANLNSLNLGDEIVAVFAGKTYRYKVESKKIIDPWKKPDNISTGAGRLITLMTCYPPGFTFKRLLVVGRLVVEDENPEATTSATSPLF